MPYTNIANAISSNQELVRLLPLINDYAIVEYNGCNVDGSCAILNYLDENGIDKSAVRRIVLLGKLSPSINANKNRLKGICPDVEISTPNKRWQEVNPRLLRIRDTLVFHIGTTAGITERAFDQKTGNGERFVDFVNKTRSAYYVCFVNGNLNPTASNMCSLRLNLRLKEFALDIESHTNQQTAFCKDKQEFINTCMNTLIPKDAFFQCADEAEHGCETCNQSENYNQRKKCPFAQQAIANHYRKGIYVPKNDVIAHQWELMASHQGYKPACIQVADDLKEGNGCEKDPEAALEIYEMYASQIGENHCVDKILEIVENEPGITRIIAIPFIARQAQDGNEDMIIKLSDAFQNSEYGLPKDIIQQKEWIQQGAENGNPRFVRAMAEMYESNEEWDDAYTWYKKLGEVSPESSNVEKLDEVELKKLTNGVSPKEVATRGRNYMYGYFGYERNLHLAYRCLKYASDNGITFAKGLLGTMYLEGLGVEPNFDYAVNLFTNAAEQGDLQSMDMLISLHHADDNVYHDGQKWESIIIDRIEEGISKGNPFAYYLKGHYQSIGQLYPHNDCQAFANIKKCAENGSPKAQFELSEMYASGNGCEQNQFAADSLLKQSAENGYYIAAGKYGLKLFNNRQREKSFNFLKHAYEQGYDEVSWRLGQCYMYGYGTPVNKETAHPLYERAAKDGIIYAQVFLCEHYFKGDENLPQDYSLCLKWGEMAIAQGSQSVRFETAYSHAETGNRERAKELYTELANEGNHAAMNNLGCLEEDKAIAAEWFKKSADKGDDVAQSNIAWYYRQGIAVERDVQKALFYYTQSAKQGYLKAIKELAKMYQNGDGVESDIHEAIKWFEKAVEQDDDDSMIDLADIYSRNNTKDIDKAMQLCKTAAEKGNSTAMYKLGELHEFNSDQNDNIHKAIYWYRKAAKKENIQAQTALKRLNSNWMDKDGHVVNLDEDNNDIDDLPF